MREKETNLLMSYNFTVYILHQKALSYKAGQHPALFHKNFKQLCHRQCNVTYLIRIFKWFYPSLWKMFSFILNN